MKIKMNKKTWEKIGNDNGWLKISQFKKPEQENINKRDPNSFIGKVYTVKEKLNFDRDTWMKDHPETDTQEELSPNDLLIIESIINNTFGIKKISLSSDVMPYFEMTFENLFKLIDLGHIVDLKESLD